MREHTYTPPKVGEGINCLRTSEVERTAFAFGYYIGRRYWTIDFPFSRAEEEIFKSDSIAYWAGYDLGSHHARQSIGLTQKEILEKSCQTASEGA